MEENLKWLWYAFSVAWVIHVLYVVTLGRREAKLREELEAYKQAMIAVMAETKRLHDAGVSADSVGAQANFGEYNGWTGRDRQTERTTPRLYMEFDGKLDTPPGTKPTV